MRHAHSIVDPPGAERPRVLGETPGYLPALRVALEARPDIPRALLLATARTTPARALRYVGAADIVRAVKGAEKADR